MFAGEPPRVKAPEGPRTAVSAPVRNIRKKKQPLYVYKNSDDPPYNEMVLSLTNGLDPELIDPELYPHLVQMLQYQLKRLKNSNPAAATKIKNSMIYMINWKPDDEPVAVRDPDEDRYMPSKHMIDEGIELAMRGGNLNTIDPRLLHFLVAPLREIRRESLDNGNYQIAQKAELGARNVLAQQLLQETMEKQDEKSNETAHKLEIAEIQLENIKEKWELLIEQRRRKMNATITQMQEEFQEFLDAFDEQFQCDPPPHKMKYSSMLLDLRAKERSLVHSKRFQEATLMKQQADAMEAREKQQRRDEWHKELLEERQKMIEKEKQREFVREMGWQSSISQMQISASEEIAHHEKTVNMLRTRLDKSNMEMELTRTHKKLPPLMMSKKSLAPRLKTVR